MRMQKLTKCLYWRRWVAVKSYNAPSHQKYMPCWGMSNGRWRIFWGGGGWLNGGLGWAPASMGDATAQEISHRAGPPCSRACKREGNFSQHPSWCACSSGCDGHGEQVKIVREKGWRNIKSTRRKLQRDVGRFLQYSANRSKALGQPWVWLCLHVDVTNPLGIDVIRLSKIQS